MQFGGGNFLRGFADWILQEMNDKGLTDHGVTVVQPTPNGRVDKLAAQDGLYTLCLEGVENGEKVQRRKIIDVLSDFIDPYRQYDKFLSAAANAELEIVISNTTEAGIVLDPSDTDLLVCPKSFPGKLLAFLKARYDHFGGDMSKGLAVIPCELIDHNGDELKRILVELAHMNGMDTEFKEWMTCANHFTNTLVDRIVPGYPHDEAAAVCEKTGFNDSNIVKGEVFHLWVLQKDPFVQKIFPADKAGLNIIFADDIDPYKQRKVRILNGSHTAMVPAAYLCGIDTVRGAVEDEDIGRFIRRLVYDEIIPTIGLQTDETYEFASGVFYRFLNPFIRHELMSIALNSTSKFVTRLLPVYNDYRKISGRSPEHILFAFAAMTVFYRGKRGDEAIALNDEKKYLDFWNDLWNLSDPDDIAEKALSAEDIWHQSLNEDDNAEIVGRYIKNISEKGMRSALRDFMGERE